MLLVVNVENVGCCDCHVACFSSYGQPPFTGKSSNIRQRKNNPGQFYNSLFACIWLKPVSPMDYKLSCLVDHYHSTVSPMPARFEIIGSNPPIVLSIHRPQRHLGVPKVFFTAAILDAYKYFVAKIISKGRDHPIPRGGLTFIVGGTSIRLLSAVDTSSHGGVLDYQILSWVLQAIWWLLNTHGHWTWIFQVLLGTSGDYVAGTVEVRYENPADVTVA